MNGGLGLGFNTAVINAVKNPSIWKIDEESERTTCKTDLEVKILIQPILIQFYHV